MEDTSGRINLCRVKTYAKIADLKIHPQNPRKITSERLEKLKTSILKKGFYEPILVWKKGAVVLSGNHRLQAARELVAEGYTFIAPNGERDVLPVVIEDIPYKVAESILFEANNHYAEWEQEKLKDALAQAEAHGSDIADFGFTDAELNKMLKSITKLADDVTAITRKDLDRELGDEYLNPTAGDPGRSAGDPGRSKIPDDREEPGLESEPVSSDFGDLEEEFGYLTLPAKQINKLKGYLVEIAKSVNPTYQDGDSLSDAADVLLKAVEHIIKDIKGE